MPHTRPDGSASIGFDPVRNTLVQNYSDSRGVARVYDMAFDDTVWTLRRLATEPDFFQRFTGRFSSVGSVITGRWETSSDGATWVHDFDLTYHASGVVPGASFDRSPQVGSRLAVRRVDADTCQHLEVSLGAGMDA